jgi:hypothetical protein
MQSHSNATPIWKEHCLNNTCARAATVGITLKLSEKALELLAELPNRNHIFGTASVDIAQGTLRLKWLGVGRRQAHGASARRL